MNPFRTASRALLAALCLGAGAAGAQSCIPFWSLPVIIETPGVFCATGYLTTVQISGAAIEINADDVTLDLSAGGIDGLAAGPGTQVIGIHAIDRSNITIRGGTIRGFLYGISLENSAADYSSTGGHVVTQNLLDMNRAGGIEVRGTNTVVTKNTIAATGGAASPGVTAINIYGPGARVVQNDIVGTASASPSGAATGIVVIGGSGCVLDQNRIVNTTAAPGHAYGAMVWSSPDCVVRHNTFDNRTTTPLDVGVYAIDSKRVQSIANTMTNVVRNAVR